MSSATPTPLPHQAHALRRFAGSSWAFFAMEMRLGKTLTFIWWARSKGDGLKLVVAPLCTFASWLGDLQKVGEPVLVLAQQPWARDAAMLRVELDRFRRSGGKFCLVNWEGLIEIGHRTPSGKPKPVGSAVTEIEWETVGLDESTRIRNPSALTTNVVLNQLSAKNRACLSGLPNPESELDLFNQMFFLRGRWCGVRSWWQARHRYYRRVGWDWVPNKGAVPLIKAAWKGSAFIATRQALGLETKPTRVVRTCELEPKARKIYDDIELNWAWGKDWAAHRMQLNVWLAGLASGWPANRSESWNHKLNLLTDLLNGEVEPELKREQVVVWVGAFRRELEAISSALGLFGVSHRTLQGGMRLEDRVRLEKDFQAGRFRVLVASAAVGRYGMDLSRAGVQIRFSYTWSFETHHQSEQRTESMVKKTPTHIISLITKDTVDEDVYAALQDKRANARNFTHLVWEKFKARITARKEARHAARR